ncbi:hypothetical protein GCM10017764_27450 [Sphingobacterium griseoflavum]|uniref:Uncharacterized protein n=1 Tax=Sphingobacterium griseoflavum TaxID=1474952 RepID=A0ABQ3I0J4_9SPHI|nr:hypothetical protein GCM10017764_27450 [Sphingobacterium griseoflavum]
MPIVHTHIAKLDLAADYERIPHLRSEDKRLPKTSKNMMRLPQYGSSRLIMADIPKQTSLNKYLSGQLYVFSAKLF